MCADGVARPRAAPKPACHNRGPVTPLLRRALFLSVPYLLFALLLLSVEGVVRWRLSHLTPLDFFVTEPQQQAQMVDARRQRIFEGDPLLFWRLVPGLRDVVWDQTPVTTNAQGLRYGHDVAPKAEGAFRILCLGDSVTFGFRVPLVFLKRPQDRDPAWLPYPARLEKRLRAANAARPVEVIPLAVPGYSSHQGLAWLRRDLGRYRPDVVTLLYGWNDVSLRPRSDPDAMKVDGMHVLARSIVSRSQALMYASRAATRAPSRGVHPFPHTERVRREQFVANLLEMARLARAAGAAPVLIGPVFRDPVEHPDEAQRMGAYRAALRDAAAREGIAYVEVPELTEAAWPGNEKLFLEHIHPNHAGHRVLAQALLSFMARRGLLAGLAAPAEEAAP
jgi:lysophospholipase L1-like esterase